MRSLTLDAERSRYSVCSDAKLIPVPMSIKTKRLLLRAFQPEDAPKLYAALSESIKDLRSNLWYLPWIAEEPTLESALMRCRKACENFKQRTDLPYLAFEHESGRMVASVGLHRTDWSLPKTEVGYWVRSSETGKGYASEVVAALTSWALVDLGAKRVELITDESNTASRRVAERCGFQLEGIMRNTMRSPDGRLRNSCVYAKLP